MTKILSHTGQQHYNWLLIFSSNMTRFDHIYARDILNEYSGQILELGKVILFTPCFGAIWWIHPGTAWMATWTEKETWTLLYAPRWIYLHSIHCFNEIVHLWWLYMLLIGLTMQGDPGVEPWQRISVCTSWPKVRPECVPCPPLWGLHLPLLARKTCRQCLSW